jgi:uncharacterized membrane protein YqjE
MSARSPRVRGLLDLWAAHRELSTLEWLEFQQTLRAAAVWLLCAAILSCVGWLALNAAVVLAFREQPLLAASTVGAVNLLGGALAGWQVTRLLKRPFFALTKREAARDVDTLIEVIS